MTEATRAVVGFTDIEDSNQAGRTLGREILGKLDGGSADVLVVFASSRYDYPSFLGALKNASRAKILVGCSSAGEFAGACAGSGGASALGLMSTDLAFTATIAHDLSRRRERVAPALAAGFDGGGRSEFPYRAALVLVDALAGHTEQIVEELEVLTEGAYSFFGGGAGDDARFMKTHVFRGTEAFTDSAVALEILSRKPIGVSARHGWTPAGAPMRVTESLGERLISIDGKPAVDAFKAHAEATGQSFHVSDPLPFFLHNVLGIETRTGFKLRVPLKIGQAGEILVAAEIATGACIRIMTTGPSCAADAAVVAARSAIAQLQGNDPAVSLMFDCAATRLRLGTYFPDEVNAVREVLHSTPLVGCNTYGQIAPIHGPITGFHNCTAVVCTLPA